MAMSIEAWLLNVNGRKIDRDGGFPAKDPYQCWDLWADYAERVVGVPLAATFTNYGGSSPHPGYACNVFHNAAKVAAIASRFVVVAPSATAQPGDVAFWEKGGLYAGSHVAIVTVDLGKTLRCMSQNKGPGLDAAAYETLSKSTLLGYLRPRVKGSAPSIPDRPGSSEKGFLMALSDQEQADLKVKVDRIDSALTQGGFHMTNAILDDQRRAEKGIMGALVELGADADHIRAVNDAIRAGQVAPGGYTYDAAILGILVGMRDAKPGEVDGKAIAAAIVENLPDTLAQQVLDGLHQRLAS